MQLILLFSCAKNGNECCDETEQYQQPELPYVCRAWYMLCYVIYTVLNAHNVHHTGTIKYWYQYVCKIKWSHSCYDHYNGQHFTQFSNRQ